MMPVDYGVLSVARYQGTCVLLAVVRALDSRRRRCLLLEILGDRRKSDVFVPVALNFITLSLFMS
jgi:hypothetical protein